MGEYGKPFTVDQKVVYPSQGVGVVTKVEEKPFKGEQVPYYTIFLADSDMTVMVPTHKAEELGIRAIVPACEAERALAFIGEEFEPNPSDWKLRYQMNLDLLKKGTVMDIAAIVRSLYHRSKVKELPIMERKLYDQALKLFQDEIATSLNKGPPEVEQLIFDHLENRLEVPGEPSVEGSVEGQAEVPVEPQVEVPVEGSIESQAEVPVEGQVEPQVEGQAEVPVEGQVENPA